MMVHELRYKGLYRYSEFCLFNLIATSFGDKCTPNKKKDQSALLLILTINTHKKDAIIHIITNRKYRHDLYCLYPSVITETENAFTAPSDRHISSFRIDIYN